MRRMVIALVLLAVSAAAPLRAQQHPSPATATRLSAGMTAVGAGLVFFWGRPLVGAATMVVGPSTGFFYAGATKRGVSSAVLRLALMTATVGMFALAWDWAGSGAGSGAGALMVLAPASGFVASAVYDIAAVGGAAREASRVNVGIDPRRRALSVGFALPF